MSCVALMNESSLSLIKGTILGQKGRLTSYNNAGKPYPPQGIEMTWNGVAWRPSEPFWVEAPHSVNEYAAPAGTTAKLLDASGNAISYSVGVDGVWRLGTGFSNALPQFATKAALVAAMPPAPFNGCFAEVARVLGSGYFRMRCNGTDWIVMMGEVVATIDSDIPHTSVGTSYVVLASAQLGGLMLEHETWSYSFEVEGDATLTSTALTMSVDGVARNIGSTRSITTQRGRRTGSVQLIGTTLRGGSTSEECTGVASSKISTAIVPSSFTMDFGVTPGAASEAMRMTSLRIRKEF